jgi:uncharacterized protein YukE
MSLQEDIATNLNAGALVTTLTSSLGVSAGSLNTLTLPVSAEQLHGASNAGAFDTEAILSAVRQVAEQAAPGLLALPVPGDLMHQITTTLEAIEQVTAHDIGASFSALTDRLTAEFEGDTQEGFVGILLRVMQVLSTAPESAILKTLFRDVTGLAGGGVRLPDGIGNALPAVINAVRVLGGLMTLESMLSEAERLTGLVAEQLDPVRARDLLDRLRTALTANVPLAQRVAATDPNDPDAVEAAIANVRDAADLMDAAETYISRGMGFGEATLAYLDVEKLQAELEIAKALLRNPDLTQLEQLIRSATDGLRPILAIDLSAAPHQPLDAVLSAVEAQIDQYVNQITAFDPATIASPLAAGLDEVSAAIRGFSDLMTRILQDIRAALDDVRRVISGLPFENIVNTLTTVLAPVQQACDAIRALVEEIRAALETAANAAIAALVQVEGGVDEFEAKLNELFNQARQFIDALPLGQAMGEISDKIKAFNDALAKLDMKPYFDTASSAIGTTADVIEKVPFGLLPDSMKSEVDEAVKPIRDVNAEALEAEIKSLLGISSGKFDLRPNLKAELVEIQQKFDDLVAVLKEHNPRVYLQTIDEELSAIATRIQAISPQLSLQPVREAIDNVKQAIGSFDLEHELEPLRDVFKQATHALQQFSPVTLIQPLEQRVNNARNQLVAAIRLNDWTPALDDLSKRAIELLDIVDPAQLEDQIAALLGEVEGLVSQMPDVNPAAWLGSLVTDLLRGTGARIYSGSFEAILGWMTAGSAANDLGDRAARISANLAHTKAAIDAVDISTLALPLISVIADLRPAIDLLANKLDANSPERARLKAAGDRLNLEVRFAALAGNRSRYLTLVNSASTLADNLSRTGISEAGIAITALQSAVAPLRDIIEVFRTLLGHIGITGFETGLRDVLQAVLSVAPASRLTAILTPLFKALRDRLKILVTAILTPIKSSIAEIKTLVALIDLGPLRASLDAVFQEVLAQINAVNPLEILKEPLAAFASLKLEISNFDPLATILNLLNQLRDTIARVLEKLSAEKLLATPIAIYDTILNDFKLLNVKTLLDPIFDRLDTIAEGVNTGLDETITAFEKLQQALPAAGGGGSAAVAVG